MQRIVITGAVDDLRRIELQSGSNVPAQQLAAESGPFQYIQVPEQRGRAIGVQEYPIGQVRGGCEWPP